MTLATIVIAFVLAAASFAVLRTSHSAAQPRKWIRNGLVGIGIISTFAMATLLYVRQGTLAFLVLAVWLPAMIVGILVERATHR